MCQTGTLVGPKVWVLIGLWSESKSEFSGTGSPDPDPRESQICLLGALSPHPRTQIYSLDKFLYNILILIQRPSDYLKRCRAQGCDHSVAKIKRWLISLVWASDATLTKASCQIRSLNVKNERFCFEWIRSPLAEFWLCKAWKSRDMSCKL